MKTIGQMQLVEHEGVSFLAFPQLMQLSWLNHAFSTRLGGVSTGVFSSMNLNFNRGDPDEHVLENYRRFCDAAGFPFDSLVASAQDHHTEIRQVTADDVGIGITKPRDRQSVDGLITDDPGVTLVTYYADCVPLYFADPVHHAIGLAHAGWRGTVAGMAGKMVQAMHDHFQTDPHTLVAAIGPSIGSCCYEVDDPVAQQVLALHAIHPDECLKPAGEGKFMLDLWGLNRKILLDAGVPDSQIAVGKVCTKCHADLLFSHRVMGTQRGGMAAFMKIKP